jgi:hypothetical protein
MKIIKAVDFYFGVIWWYLDPTRLFDHIPGFNSGYEWMYNRWAARENKKARES